jgi:hypothetical protein
MSAEPEPEPELGLPTTLFEVSERSRRDRLTPNWVDLAADVNVIVTAPLCISLAILHIKSTGWRQDDGKVRG